MTEPPTPPAWVRKRDGSRAPFDADQISQALFAATEALGRPDAFLARELTDGVLHFLAVEKDDDTLTTAQIADIVAKTVRELGQPALAEAYTAGPRESTRTADAVVLHAPRDVPPRGLFANLLRDYAQQAIYSRQVLAAQSDGLLTLTGLDAPGELEACVIGPFASAADALADLRSYVGGCAVFDGPEYWLAAHGGSAAVPTFVRDVSLASRFLGLRVVLNLNSAEPPSWAGELARGPLFAEQHAAPDEATLALIADAVLEQGASVPIAWHLGDRDFAADPPRAERLRRVSAIAATEAPLTFVFDRPRRPLLLAAGMDRQHAAVLLTVGLHLPRLAEQAGLREDAALFLQKLGSLARLAISAAVQKREYLRRLERGQPSPLTTGFLLDRARLVVAPIGLDYVVQQMLGRGLTSGGAALDLGKQIVTRLRDVLKQDGKTAHLDGCIDGPSDTGLPGLPVVFKNVAGLTAWDANAAAKNQLRATGSLHALADRGLMLLFLGGSEFTSHGIAKWLHDTWKMSDVARLRVMPY